MNGKHEWVYEQRKDATDLSYIIKAGSERWETRGGETIRRYETWRDKGKSLKIGGGVFKQCAENTLWYIPEECLGINTRGRTGRIQIQKCVTPSSPSRRKKSNSLLAAAGILCFLSCWVRGNWETRQCSSSCSPSRERNGRDDTMPTFQSLSFHQLFKRMI